MIDPKNLKYCLLVTARQAEAYGFVIEKEVGFLFNLGGTIAILAYNNLDEVWQFDTATNDDGDSYQFVEPSLQKALHKAENISRMMESYAAFWCEDGVEAHHVDCVGVLQSILAKCK